LSPAAILRLELDRKQFYSPTFTAVDILIFHYASMRRGKSRPSEMKRKNNKNQENNYIVKASSVVRSLA